MVTRGWVFFLLLSCAPPAPANTPTAASAPADSEPAQPVEKEEEPPPPDVPVACADAPEQPKEKEKDKLCAPDPDYAKRLCHGGPYPDVALVMLGKDSKLTRMYLRGDVDGWNAEGGTSTRSKLAFDEEVVVLKRRTPPPNAIVVNGAGYLVLRWDGNCYTLDEGELTARRPPAAKHGPVPWRHYSDRTKDALLQNPRIAAALQKRDKECQAKDAPACEKADAAFGDVVVTEVRGGLAIPQPEHRP